MIVRVLELYEAASAVAIIAFLAWGWARGRGVVRASGLGSHDRGEAACGEPNHAGFVMMKRPAIGGGRSARARDGQSEIKRGMRKHA